MKIVFDAYWWGGGPPSLRHVSREIILAWQRCFPADDVIVVTRRRHHVPARADRPNATLIHETSIWPQGLAARTAIGRIARAHKADAVITHNFAPRLPGGTSAIYLHDVLFVTNPEWFTPLERGYFSLMTRWIGSADVVLTSSAAEGERIAANTRARRVVPVGLGLSTELQHEDQFDADPSLTRGHFMLTVGRLNVRKNLERTILAALDTGIIRPQFPLIVVGSPDGKASPRTARVAEAVLDGTVVFTGFVPESRLRWLYENTALFVCLSLGEGYGMPPVEAAVFGAPVLASDLAVFHENLGDLARYVDPGDIGAITDAMRRQLVAAPGQWDIPGDSGHHPTAAAQRLQLLQQHHNWSSTVNAMRSALVNTPAVVTR